MKTMSLIVALVTLTACATPEQQAAMRANQAAEMKRFAEREPVTALAIQRISPGNTATTREAYLSNCRLVGGFSDALASATVSYAMGSYVAPRSYNDHEDRCVEDLRHAEMLVATQYYGN